MNDAQAAVCRRCEKSKLRRDALTTGDAVLNLLWDAFEKSGYGAELSIGHCAQELAREPDDQDLKEAIEDLCAKRLIAESNQVNRVSRKIGLTVRGWEQCAGSIGGVRVDTLKCQILTATLLSGCDGDQLSQRITIEQRHLRAAVELLIAAHYLDVTRIALAKPFGGYLNIKCTPAGRAAQRQCAP